MLNLAFITSSRIKRAHAEYLCRNYDLVISGQKNYGVGYNEPRITQKEQLLEQSITDALKRWRKNASSPDAKFFFIEDTSVVIHALSSDDEEVPGVDIKYWMREHDFESVDALLKQHGNNRQVTVFSTVLLCVPKELEGVGGRHLYFVSSSSGKIVDREHSFVTNPVYPWLDNKTFNKWFVPDGCEVPISMLEIREADKHDFRVGAFNGMLEFLVKHGVLKKKDFIQHQAKQIALANLPIKLPMLYLISGPTCAGKTTLAQYLVKRYGYYHIEASDFMYLSYYQKHGVGSSVKIRDFAHAVLKEDPAIVVRQIIRFLPQIGKASIVLTGFRDPREVDVFFELYKGTDNIEVIYIDADAAIRYKRYADRARHGLTSIEEFERENIRQVEMGIKEIGAKYCDDHLYNEASFDALYSLFDKMYGCDIAVEVEDEKIDLVPPSALEDAILIAMLVAVESGRYYTTTEISKLIGDAFREFDIKKDKNNVSRYFNQYFRPYFEIAVENDTRKYRLSETGKMHAKWLMEKLKGRKPSLEKKKPHLPSSQQSLFD